MKEIFAGVSVAVEEERQSQAAVSSSKEASSTGERAQFVKQSCVRVSSNEDMKHSLTDANSVKPAFVRSSPDTYQSAGTSETAVLAPPAS